MHYAPPDVLDVDDDDSLSDDDGSSSSGSSRSSSSSSSSGYFPMQVRSLSSRLSNASYVSSESESFVYCEDPSEYWGWGGYMGAVTRTADSTDDSRTRFAAHFMAGPFAQTTRKQTRRHRKRRGSAGEYPMMHTAGGTMAPPPPMMHAAAGQMPPQPPMMQRPPMFHGAAGMRPGMGVPPMMPQRAAFMPGMVPQAQRPPMRQVDPVWGNGPQRRFSEVKTGGPPRTRVSVV